MQTYLQCCTNLACEAMDNGLGESQYRRGRTTQMVGNKFDRPTMAQEKSPTIPDFYIVVPKCAAFKPYDVYNAASDISILLCSHLADIPNGA